MPSKGRPDRGNPQLKLRLDPRLWAGLEIEATKRGLTIQQAIYAIVEGYLAAVVGGPVVPQASPRELQTLNQVILTKLRLLLGQLRFEVATSSLATVRRKRLKDLDKAAKDLGRMADEAKDLDQRLKIYQVMGYLCQIIDGLLLNIQKDEILRLTQELKKRIDLLEASREGAQRPAGTPNSAGKETRDP